MKPWPAQDDGKEKPLFFAEYRRHSHRLSVAVHDISVAGCLVSLNGLGGDVGDRVLIQPPGLSYLAATVLWVDEDKVGLEFEHPLYEPVLVHLLKSHRR